MDRFTIAKIGKTVGLKGELKLHLLTDFESQFVQGAEFESDKEPLIIKSYNPQRALVSFVGYESIEAAKKLTNSCLYSNEERTRQLCKLDEGEKFWFDMIGLSVIDDGKVLGKVVDIDRIAGIEYFKIQTDSAYKDIAKRFLIPNIDRYIVKKADDAIYTRDCMEILEQS